MKTKKYDYHLTPENPFFIYYGNNPPPDKHHLPATPDIHYALHFGIMLSGGFESCCSDFHRSLDVGDVWFSGSWEPHVAVRRDTGTEFLLMTILPEKLGDTGIPANINWMLPFVTPPSGRPQVANNSTRVSAINTAREILHLHNAKTPGWNALCWFKLHELLLLIMNADGFIDKPEVEEQNLAYERVQPAIKLIKEKNGRQISITDAATACYLGKSRFCDLFRTATGTTFAKYAARTRISMAAAEIKKNRSLIKEVAEAWGYFDESHFYRAFRQYFHCSPSDFRENNIDLLHPLPDDDE